MELVNTVHLSRRTSSYVHHDPITDCRKPEKVRSWVHEVT